MPSSRAGNGEAHGAPELGPTGPLRIGFVVPRFGERVVGGAELLARWLAERLVGIGHSVEVLTTCGETHRGWENVLPPGVEQHGDITVRRFLVDPVERDVYLQILRAIDDGYPVSWEEELLWLRNGVASTDMEEEIAARGDRYDVILTIPYMFGPAFFTYLLRPERTVLIPCLHDERYARMAFVREMLRGVRGLMFNAYPEATLAGRLVGELPPWTVVGSGFDPPTPGDPEAFRRRHGVREPIVLYVGRRESAKNTHLLTEYFSRFRNRTRTDATLVFVGSGEPVPRLPGITEVEIDWGAERDTLYRAATVFCQPSVNESFSIVLMQAWLAERPALVNGRCEVTRDHCERSNGGLWFGDYPEFEETLGRLLADPSLRESLGGAGASFVRREHSWDAVLGRFQAAVRTWIGGEAGLLEAAAATEAGS